MLELVKKFEKVNGIKISYKIVDRRAGDIATCYANVTKTNEVLGWKAELGIEDIVRDAWRWEQNYK